LSQYKVGLWVFLGVATVLFAISISAYFARMRLLDWQPLQEPGLLWINTAVLFCASVVMQMAVAAGRANRVDIQGRALWTGGGLAILFLLGQIAAWQQLQVDGYAWTKNPADSFFYLLTSLHGLHLLGGLVAWGRTMYKRRQHINVQLSIELCAVYWHFLLIIWLVLFGILLST
jgi:cytochrome c oxidase subunit 3